MKPTIVSLARWTCLALAATVEGVRCPPRCQELFGRLEDGIQEVQVQLRGEPKSGTGTAGEWAYGGLAGTCLYLRSLYGNASCHVNHYNDLESHDIVFEPGLSVGDKSAPCSCDTITRVVIGYSKYDKHSLPVNDECAYAHSKGLPRIDSGVCRHGQDSQEEDWVDLWRCLEDARCTSSDERLQLAVIRDPRAVTVSGYFHSVKHTRGFQQAHPSVDQYFQQNLGFISRWTTVRYLLFTELLADRSHVVTFEDLMVDPVDWYGRFLHFIGLNLPSEVIFDIARVASEEGPKIYGRIRKGVDEHPGSIVPEGSRRTFRDELGQTSLEMMDDVMRPLLPPALLKRFGVDMQ